MKRWFEGSGLSVKLLAGGVATILAIAILWIASASFFTGNSTRADQIRSLSNRIVIGLYETRTKEKNFLLRDLGEESFYARGESEGLKAFARSMATLREHVAALKRLLGDHDELVGRIDKAVEAYNTQFMALVAAYRELGAEDWGIRGRWREQALAVEKQIYGSGNNGLLEALNQLRKHEVRYARSHEDRYLRSMREAIERMRGAAQSLDAARGAALQAALDKYEQELSAFASTMERIGASKDSGLQAQFREAANSVEPLVKEVLKEAVAASEAARSNLIQANWGISVLGLVFGVVIFYLLSRNITRPLKMVTEAARHISAGDVAVELGGEGRRDEIGVLMASFRSLVESFRARADLASRIANGDLTVEMGHVQDSDVLGMALKGMFDNLRAQIGEIREGASVLGSSTAEISASIAQVTSSATETATAVTQTMSTTEELRQTSELSSQKAGNVSKTARSSSDKSSEAMRSISEVTKAMEHIRSQMEAIGASVISLSEQSKTIGEIISTVDDLAEQSNILSVNASIEAAKTGEHGKGFAVVAQEIKNLAEQSKEATKRVRMILSDIQKATSDAVMVTEQGSKAVEQGASQTERISDAVKSLVESIEEVDQAAIQIAASSKQQLSGVEQVAAAVEDIQASTEQNVQSMEQLEKAAMALEEVGRGIKGLVERYRL